MISIQIIIVILFTHWVADFVFQTQNQAVNKSISIKTLLSHTIIYAGTWLLIMPFLIGFFNSLLFVLITFVLHTTMDYVTSRLNSDLWQRSAMHNFFVSIGLDQYIHLSLLFLTYLLFI